MTILRVNDGVGPWGYPVIRDLAFASCYAYAPSGTGAASERSRRLCGLLKSADRRYLKKYAVRVCEQVASGPPLGGFFGPQDVLIPVPGSVPLPPGVSSVADRLAAALVRQNVGAMVWCGLHRIVTVPKSAMSLPGCRPTVGEHFESLAVDSLTWTPGRVVLVDDVVTKGRTLLAAAARVREAFPGTQVSAFALLRTLGFVREVRRFLQPCVGEIRWRAGDAIRTP